MRTRELLVILAAALGCAAGFYLGGGRATPAQLLADPAIVDAWGSGPVLGMVAGTLGLGWVVNRWIEHRPSGEGTPGT